MDVFNSPRGFRRNLLAWALLGAAEAFAALFYLILIPADPKNSILMGYSLPRLVIMAVMLFLALAMLNLAWRSRRSRGGVAWFEQLSQRKPNLQVLWGIVFLFFLAGWLLVFLPGYRFGSFATYAERLRPFTIWLVLVCAQTLFLFRLLGKEQRVGIFQNKANIRRDILISAVPLAVLLAAWVFIAVTGYGLKPDSLQWNDNGVPLLGLQVLGALGLGLAAAWLVDRLAFSSGLGNAGPLKRAAFEVGIALLVWLVAALIWSQTPAQRNFFAPGPYLPNEEYYPFSDSTTYDLSAQAALVGQLFSSGEHVDKPLYSLILLTLQGLSGNRYNLLLSLQAALLAALPMFLYLVGKSLHSRAAGLVAAVLAIFKEINAYSILTIQVSHSRLILSEVPTALFLALFTLCMVCWLKQPSGKMAFAAAAGGALGLSTLLRHNVWLLLPFVAVTAAIVYGRNWRRLVLSGLVFGGAFLLAILPWAWRTVQVTGNPLYFLGPLEGVVWEQRYQPILETPTPVIATEQPPAQGLSPVAAAPALPPVNEGVGGVSNFILAHFFHNLVATTMILPNQVAFDDLQHVVSGPESLYSTSTWHGNLSLENSLMILLGLGLFSVGVGSAWKRWKWAGLVPLGTFIVYTLAAGVARTSGGRYIVPVDWAAYFYYAIGLVQVIGWLAAVFWVKQIDGTLPDQSISASPGGSTGWRSVVVVAGLYFIVGLALPVSEHLIPLRYPPQSRQEILAGLKGTGALDQPGGGSAGLEAFIKNDTSVVLYGRGLYPRFYRMNEGEPDIYSLQKYRNFPRLTFTMIGPQPAAVLLPMLKSPAYFPNGSDVYVLGCKDSFVDAAAIAVRNSQTGEWVLYQRSPAAPLTCPLRQPVCDDNHKCQ